MATTKIELFKLDIDADAVVKTASDMKLQLDLAKDSLKALGKESGTSSVEFVKQQAKVNSLNEEYRTSQRELTKLTSLEGKEIKSIQEARNALSVVTSQWAKQADLYGENSIQAEQLAKQKLHLTEQIKKEESATGDNTRNVGNYTEGMKAAFAQTGFFGQSISTVTELTTSFGPVLQVVSRNARDAGNQIIFAAAGTETMSKSQKIMAVSTNIASGALKLFKVALISTGIGAIIVLLGSFVAYLSTTQKGIDAVSKVLTPLKVVFETLFGVLQQVGEALADLFTADGIKKFGTAIQDFVMSRIDLMKRGFTAIGKILTGDIKEGLNDLKGIASQVKNEVVDGVNAMKGAADGLADTMKTAYERGERIAALQIQIEENENSLIKKRSELNLITKQMNKIAEDITKTDQERVEAAKAASKAQSDLLMIENDLLDKKIEKMKLEQIANDSSREDLKELAELEAEKNEKATANAEIQTTLQNKLNTVETQRHAKALKAVDNAIAANKTELDLYLAQSNVKAKTLEDEVKVAEYVRDEKLKILSQEIKAGKKTKEQAALEEFNIKQAFLDAQTLATIDNAGRELEEYINGHQSKLDADQFFSEESAAIEEERLNGIFEQRTAHQAKLLDEGVISQTAYNDAINAIDEENRLLLEEIAAERKLAKAEQALVDLELKRELDQANIEFDLESQLSYLEQDRINAVAAAEKVGADTTLVNDKYAAMKVDIERQVNNAKVSLAADAFGNLAEIAGKESKAGKAFAIAQTTITTLQSAVNSYNSLSGIPIVGPILGAVAAAAAVASGYAQIKKIKGTKEPSIPKAEKGGTVGSGMLTGNSHANGGIPIEAEGGEYIVNKSSSSKYRGLLDMINFGSAKREVSNHGVYANGGIVSRSIQSQSRAGINQQPLDADAVAVKLAEAYAALPPSQVAVSEFNEVNNRVTEVEAYANI